MEKKKMNGGWWYGFCCRWFCRWFCLNFSYCGSSDIVSVMVEGWRTCRKEQKPTATWSPRRRRCPSRLSPCEVVARLCWLGLEERSVVACLKKMPAAAAAHCCLACPAREGPNLCHRRPVCHHTRRHLRHLRRCRRRLLLLHCCLVLHRRSFGTCANGHFQHQQQQQKEEEEVWWVTADGPPSVHVEPVCKLNWDDAFARSQECPHRDCRYRTCRPRCNWSPRWPFDRCCCCCCCRRPPCHVSAKLLPIGRCVGAGDGDVDDACCCSEGWWWWWWWWFGAVVVSCSACCCFYFFVQNVDQLKGWIVQWLPFSSCLQLISFESSSFGHTFSTGRPQWCHL